MELEDALKSFHLSAPAGDLRSRVLRAARRAGRERRLWRWTWVAAAAVLAAAIPVNASLERPGPPDPVVRRDPALEAMGRTIRDGALELRIRLAHSARPAPPPRFEVNRWVH